MKIVFWSEFLKNKYILPIKQLFCSEFNVMLNSNSESDIQKMFKLNA
jgi:hypothetical protein